MATAPSDYQNPECYARALGACCAKISREHYVSEGILKLIEGRFGKENQTVDGTNLAFQKPGVKNKLTIGRLTAPILCETHNGMLSPFDNVGRDMFVAMDAINESAADPSRPASVFHVNGDALERWMLKTLYGGLYSGKFRMPTGESLEGVSPPISWLQILYKWNDFPDGLGLHYVYRQPSETITTDPLILKMMPLLATTGEVMGLRLWLFGFEFDLLTARVTPGIPTRFDDAAYRPAGFREIETGARIQFGWKDGARSPGVEVKSLGPPQVM